MKIAPTLYSDAILSGCDPKLNEPKHSKFGKMLGDGKELKNGYHSNSSFLIVSYITQILNRMSVSHI